MDDPITCMNVLVVDDSAPMALLIAATLRGLAERIEVASTFAAAKEWLQKLPFGLVLLDLGLPDSFPEQTVERVSEMRETGAKVVILTGRWPIFSRITPETTGADAVLFKGDDQFREKLQAMVAAAPA